jgi:small subunit ribosomal protein S5
MVVGDGKGTVGVGMGKSAEVPDAVSKAVQDAKKNLVKITLKGTTIPHDVVAEYGASLVVLKPAAEGTGVIAGGAVRDVLMMAGVKDIRTKALRSRNPKNLAKATVKGLMSLRDAQQIAETRGKSVEEVIG